MGRLFAILFLGAVFSAPLHAGPKPPGRVRSFWLLIWDTALPNFNFKYEKTPLPLKDVTLFGAKPFTRGTLSQYSIPMAAVKSYRLVEDILNPPLRLTKLFLLPGVPGNLESRVDTLYRIAEKRELTPDEMAELDRKGQTRRFERWKADRTGCRYAWGKVATAGTWAVRGLAAVSALHAARMLADPGSTPSIEEYLSNPRYQPKPDEIQLWSETTPFPHMAVRVRDKIYSYGVTHLSASTPEEYLRIRELNAIRQKIHALYAREEELDPKEREELNRVFPREDWVLEQDSDQHPDSSGSYLDWAAKKLGADKLERSVQVVTKRIGEQKVNAIKLKLEMSRGMEYQNETGVFDCATPVCREIGLWNPLRDAFPGTLITTLSAQRAVDPSVTDVFQIEVEGPENRMQHIARNAYINWLEGDLRVSSAIYNLPRRAYLELTKHPEDLQWWGPQAKVVFKEFEKQADDEHTSEGKIILLQRRARQLANGKPTPEEKATFLQVIDNYFGKEIRQAKETARFVDSEQKEILMAQRKAKLLKATRDGIRKMLGELK